MNILGLIPARYASTRFPGKPLVPIRGKSMIERVYTQASKSGALSRVIVATDDARIYEHVRSFGGEAVMTAETHASGTDRCAEVAATIGGLDAVINIQGDEPYIDPSQIDLLAACFQGARTEIATLVKKVGSYEELHNPNIPKVVLDQAGHALYFSRHPLPYQREPEPGAWLSHHTYYKHIGIYGFRASLLPKLAALPVSPLERSEGLEQLRWLEHGYRIITRETTLETIAIDTPEDLLKLSDND